MNLSVDPWAAAAGAQGLAGNAALIGSIAMIGLFGRLVFVALAPAVARSNPFRNFSGAGFILLAAALFAGGLYASGKMSKAAVLFKRHLADPVIVTWLGRDSCDPADGSYCVVVFENGEEKIVNWYNKRVYMWEIVNPPEGAVWHTMRPRARPGPGARG
ncbi:hypothetical protein [Leisingera sp. McT4-56]|uniref:hypothetical protein n=1 Tax=Leisingera sp. McT4-56 TaxID=2881255 RepID=UPI001CF82EBC|nr:hypothetical protein [Leisingera sp. McT4-56]MCB4456335.1 hypothetical protein [Leisingera sp. McT4-56]